MDYWSVGCYQLSHQKVETPFALFGSSVTKNAREIPLSKLFSNLVICESFLPGPLRKGHEVAQRQIGAFNHTKQRGLGRLTQALARTS